MTTATTTKRTIVTRVACGLLVVALSCTGVALAADKPAAADTEKTAAEFTWTPDMDCSLCHSVQADSLKGIAPEKEAPKVVVPPGRAASVKQAEPAAEEEAAEVLAGKHGTLECGFCHADEEALAAVHKDAAPDAKMPKELTVTEVDPTVCETCHGSLEELAEKTEDSTALTDRKGTVVNPHALPDTEKHAEIACGDCHKMHSADEVSVTASKECATCHHEGVFECGTCHEAK